MDNKKNRVLFLSSINTFDKIANGGTKVSHNNYNVLLNKYGRENVYAIILTNDVIEENENIIKIQKHRNKIEFFLNSLFLRGNFNKKKEKEIVKFILDNQIDLVFFDGSIYGRIIKDIAKYNIRTIVFYHNIEKDFAWYIVKNKGPVYLVQFFSYWYNEKLSAQYGMKHIVLNKRDEKRLKDYYHQEADYCIPVFYKDVFNEQNDKTEKGFFDKKILFVGASGLQANVDSALWFAKEVMVNLPDCTLEIVGKGFERIRSEFEEYRNVHVVGTVDKTDEWYYQAGCVVEPILYGAGMKTKTAEAMMFGKVIFASDEALEGYEIENINGIVKCNKPKDYIEKIQKYFNGLCNGYDKEVRKLFLEKYEEEAMNEAYFTVFNAL